MLTVKQVAIELGLSPSCVYELISQRRLAAVRLGPRGGAIRIRTEDLDSYLAACRAGEYTPVLPERRIRLQHVRVQ